MSSRIQPVLRSIFVTVSLLISSAALIGVLPTLTSAVEVGKQEPLTIVTATTRAEFKVEIADTDAAREEGLMFRASMPADAGMLFDFKVTDRVYFWMKNTYVPLDMIFIRADGTVAHVAANTKPLSEETVPSELPVRFVLEVNAGTAERIGLKVGDKVLNRLMKSVPG